MKKSTRQKGKLGEDIALKFLQKKGYQLMERNFTVRGGEIDLVTQKDGILIFVEVKTRWGKRFGTAEDSFNWYKKRVLIKTIAQYISKKNVREQLIRWRCDLITIDFQSTQKATIQHFKDVYAC